MEREMRVGMLIVVLGMNVSAHAQIDETGGLVKAAESVMKYAIAARRAIHENPELRWKEDQTVALIEQEVQKIITANKNGPITIVNKRMAGGLVVDVKGEISKKKLFRADIDALPLTEAVNVPYASKVPGVMHACGHDAHAAMLLAALRLILEGKVKPRNSLRFVFQRAEENPINESEK
jgi:amidohydrolase